MIDFRAYRPAEVAERVAFYRRMAADALRRAQTATSLQARATFLQIAESYKNMESAVEDMASKCHPHS
jgi:hypothetical protein